MALYDFGMTDDGTCYLVMELLDGVDLETLVQVTGPLPPESDLPPLPSPILLPGHGAGSPEK